MPFGILPHTKHPKQLSCVHPRVHFVRPKKGPDMIIRTAGLRLAARGSRLLSTRALVLNAGSSSLKYGLFELGAETKAVCSGLVERVGSAGSSITHKLGDKKTVLEVDLPDHGVALENVVSILTEAGGPIGSVDEIAVVGHRVVHGGPTLTKPAVVDAAVEAEIERCVPLAPLHNPANLLGIQFARKIFPTDHVAIFDTAFHSTMQPDSYM